MKPDWSRRSFLASSLPVGGMAWLKLSSSGLAAVAAGACSARDAGSSFESFSTAQAEEIAAIAARLIPSTETPGASEAGVIYFIDQVFAAEADELAGFLAGLADYVRQLQMTHPGSAFSSLPAAAQDAYLTTQEGSAFFESVRELTILGFFAMSAHGGNRAQLSWELIGFEGHGAWTAPFGHYDRGA